MRSKKRTVLLGGASGLVGRALSRHFESAGDEVRRLVRRAPEDPRDFRWDPTTGDFDERALIDVDAVIHLGGEGIAEGRWTDARKKVLLESRTASTSLLREAIGACPSPPKAFMQASAVGYYGPCPSGAPDEGSPLGQGFLASVVDAWERSGRDGLRPETRWVALRLGVVLAEAGGMLARLLPLFRVGGGGPILPGTQALAWVSLTDVVRATAWLLDHEDAAGPFNIVGPARATQADFAKALGKRLGRPAVIPVPRFAITTLFGEMGRETVLADQHVVPKRLTESGFSFSHRTLEEALAFELER